MEDTSYEEIQKQTAETKERLPISEVLRLVDGKVPLLIEVKLPCRYRSLPKAG